MRQAGALEQAEQVEFALGLHFVQHLLGRKIVDPDDDALAELAKPRWQARENLMRHGLHLGQRGGFCCDPHVVLLAPVPTGFASAQLTLARQSETLRSATGSQGECDGADRNGGDLGRVCRRLGVVPGRGAGADRAVRRACGAGDAISSRAAAPRSAAHADQGLSDLRTGPDGVYPRYNPGPTRCANATPPMSGIPAERHGDRAPDELLLAAGLAPAQRADQACADHQRRGSVDDDGHRKLGETACGARTPAGALRGERSAGPEQGSGGSRDGQREALDPSLARDDAMTISSEVCFPEDTDDRLCRFWKIFEPICCAGRKPGLMTSSLLTH